MEIFSLILILKLIASLSESFNIDCENPVRFLHHDPVGEFFGYSVHQAESVDGRETIVGNPLDGNSTGAMYRCTSDLQSCTPLHQPAGSGGGQFFGFSSAVSRDASLTSCSPYLPHECDENSYLNGACFTFNSSHHFLYNFTPAYQECTKREVNLVFLFDGSRSLTKNDFQLNKNFIKDVMQKLSNSSIKFAAVQFAKFFTTTFDFNDYQNGFAEEKLMKEEHMNLLTNTFGAMKYTLEKLLNNVSSGANPSALQVLVVITDGDPTDSEKKDLVLPMYNEKNIIRYIIGVGKIIDLGNLRNLASEPKANNTFHIQDYKGLEGLLDNLQKKIYNIEGSTAAHSKDRQKELSQGGFSLVYQQTEDISPTDRRDSLILCAVGSNDWRGSLYEVSGSGSGMRETEIRDPSVEKDSYMGYSAVLGMRGHRSLLFSGAPRAQHKGLVTLFTKNKDQWTPAWNISGEQIGSYFGASLSMLDVDSDGYSDFLLVGAPLFHQAHPRAEGKLYIYSLLDQCFQEAFFTSLCTQKVLNVSGWTSGRFAASVASLQDLNGDRLSDVAVGAPLEDDGDGAMYIYLGDRRSGISLDHPPQRIAGRVVLPGLQQFGVSVSGQMDMNNDNLIDLVIGAQGGVVQLKARPVMSISARINFTPSEINLNLFECPSDSVLNVFNLSSCFTVVEKTNSSGTLNRTLNVSLRLGLDVMRELNRGFFQQNDSSSRSLLQVLLLQPGTSCFFFPIFMLGCVANTVSPLKIRMTFSESEEFSGSSGAVLDVQSLTEESVEVGFRRSCASNSSCVSDLQLDFTFMNETLLVSNHAHFSLLISVCNHGDDSFNTSMELRYPEGLSFAKLTAIKPSRTRSSCSGYDGGATNITSCSIDLPVYRSGASTQFVGGFRMWKWDQEWLDRIEIIISANSDNNRNDSNTVVKRGVAVQFSVDLALSLVAEDSVTYINFTLDDPGPRNLSIFFKLENLALMGLPVHMLLHLPCTSPHMSLRPQRFSRLQDSSETQCTFTQPQEGHCGSSECAQFHLNKSSSVLFLLTAEATLENLEEHWSKHTIHEIREDFSFSIRAEIHFNQRHFNQTATGLKDDPHRSQVAVKVELIIPPSTALIVGVASGGGVILLIIIMFLLVKCGFFRRKHPEEFYSENWNTTALEVSAEDSFLMKSRDQGREKEEEQTETGGDGGVEEKTGMGNSFRDELTPGSDQEKSTAE
ncbi:hypothetical protein DNTS_030232 [Danionella cerebrum]|uniref:VWFA domain-containing protein n=1 Tax=Danionella cerebrum TaxID=2873325 RepID=A0A553Q8D7_9TELE|nr:hypothetical protein DNTS_030232 [Danionella translucida]